MKCQVCGKNEANVRYYENINGNQKEILVCSECAEKLGFIGFSNIFSPIFTSFPSFVSESDEEDQKCSECGYSFEEYTKTGLLGCPNCYEAFKDRLDKLFLKIHGKNEHIGVNSNYKNKKFTLKDEEIKKPRGDKKSNKLTELRQKLREYIDKEEYEQAALVRDEIRKLEK